MCCTVFVVLYFSSDLWPDIDILRLDIHILRPNINILRPDIHILSPDIDILRPFIDILRPFIDILRPDIDILRPHTDILRPDILRPDILNFEKKLSQLTPCQFFFSKFCHPRRRFWAIIENKILPDHVLY